MSGAGGDGNYAGDYKVHPASAKVLHASLDRAFSVPPTVEGVAQDGMQLYDQFLSMEQVPLVGGDKVSWEIAANTRAWTVPSESFIRLRGYFALPAASWDPYNGVPVGLTITTTPLLSCGFFDNVEIQMDDTLVVQSEGSNQPFCQLASVLKNESYTDRKTGNMNRGYFLDAPMQSNWMGNNRTTNKPYPNLPAMERSKLFIGDPGFEGAATAVTNADAVNRQIDIVVRLSDLGFRCNDWIPPGVRIYVRARMLPEGFRIIGQTADVAACNPTFTFAQRPTFMVSRRTLDEVVHMSMIKQWRTAGITLPYERVRSFTQTVPAGSATVDITNVFPGRCPTSVWAFWIRQTAYNGNGAADENPFALAPQGVHWINTRLQVGGGRFHPILQINTAAGQLGPGAVATHRQCLTTGELYQLYLKTSNADPFLEESDFTNIAPLVFPVQEQMREAGLLNFGSDTSITFHGELSAPPADAGPVNFGWNLILIAFTDRMLTIHADGSINPDA